MRNCKHQRQVVLPHPLPLFKKGKRFHEIVSCKAARNYCTLRYRRTSAQQFMFLFFLGGCPAIKVPLYLVQLLSPLPRLTHRVALAIALSTFGAITPARNYISAIFKCISPHCRRLTLLSAFFLPLSLPLSLSLSLSLSLTPPPQTHTTTSCTNPLQVKFS